MSTKVNRGLIRTLAAAVLLVSVTSACSLIPKEEEVLQPPLVKPQRETYETTDVVKGTLVKQIKSTGVFESVASVFQEFLVTGKLAEISVRQGDVVKKGDVLMKLDVENLELNVKQCELDVEKAKIELDKAKELRDTAQMKVKLLQLEIAQAKLEDAQKQLSGKSLIAKMDGVATFVENAKLGDAVQLNKTYVKIDDPSQLRISYTANNPGDIADIQVGMKAEVGYKGQKLEGKVVQTPANAPQTDNKALSDKYAKTLYVTMSSFPKEVSIGQIADISIITQTKDNVVKIPTRFLGSYLGRYYVKVLEGDSVKEIDVEKGLESTNPAEVEIVKGLKEGQKVIVQQ